ncbi:MAG TPA: tetratricopeptide repeat protein [Polyangiaceae bacterium]|jgi:tetratricopeptide (TPR) repeat protein
MSAHPTRVLPLAAVAAVVVLAAGCSRNNIEAVNLANEGDQAKSSNIEEAISKYEQATKLDPDNARIWWKLALAYEKKEDFQKMATACTHAEEAAEKADKKKTHADYYFRHGYALDQLAEKGQGSWADAKAPLQTAIQLDPNFGQAYGELGWVLIHADDEAGAIQNWTKALEVKPDETQYYVELADEYTRLMFFDQAEQVLREGLSFAKEDDKHLFNLHALLGSLYENKADIPRAVTEYEAAKKACEANKCNDHKEAYFNLGTAYSELNPPRKNEAIQQLQSFWKITCKGALAVKYADQCSQSQEITRRMGGSLQ